MPIIDDTPDHFFSIAKVKQDMLCRYSLLPQIVSLSYFALTTMKRTHNYKIIISGVFQVTKSSPADLWGIKAGDSISKINGKDTKMMGFQDVTDIIQNSSTSLELVLER